MLLSRFSPTRHLRAGLPLLLSLLSFALISPALANPKIAYVDLQRAVFEVAEGRAAKALLE
ncbi:MAG: hypothetical protein VYD19_00370 [Myxococcota bacterium]|nr:hypothetical protein [Myxococcota bacterium]